MLLSCDMGEGFGPWRMGDDAAMMPHIALANVACGFHAGDPTTMQATVELARAHGVGAGAHPGYPDLPGFGRRAMVMRPAEITAMVRYQVGALVAFLTAAGMSLTHVKPHGALYGASAVDEQVAQAIADAVEPLEVPILGMAGTAHESVYRGRDIAFWPEYYADLGYADDASLVITREHEVVDIATAVQQLRRVIDEGVAVTRSGREIPMVAEVVCVHSDTPGAVELAAALSREIDARAGTRPDQTRNE